MFIFYYEIKKLENEKKKFEVGRQELYSFNKKYQFLLVTFDGTMGLFLFSLPPRIFLFPG